MILENQPYALFNKVLLSYVNITYSIKEFVKRLSVMAFVKDHRTTKLF